MKSVQQRGKLTPLIAPVDGVWLSPEQAAPLFKNGKGITVNTLMNNIYAGKLNGFVKRDILGWWIFIPNHIAKSNPLKAA